MGHGDRVDSILETKIHIFPHSCCITRYLTLVILHPSLHGSVIKFGWIYGLRARERGEWDRTGFRCWAFNHRALRAAQMSRKIQDSLEIPVSWFAGFVGGLGFSSVSML